MFKRATIAAMQAHTKAQYPLEACGLIVGGEYLPQDNVADDPATDFVIAPGAYLAHAGRIEAVAHSHPVRAGEPVCPTAVDMRGQLSTAVPWGIAPVVDGEPREPFWWGDSLPIPPLERREFVHGVTDCYALVRDYFRLEGRGALPQIPRDDEWWADGGDLYEEGLRVTPGVRLIERADVRPGDVMLFRIKSRRTNHAGIYVGDGQILHHLHGRLSGREDVSRFMRCATYFARYEP